MEGVIMAIPYQIQTSSGEFIVELAFLPDECPICGLGIESILMVGFGLDQIHHIELVFRCPRLDCQHLFIGYYTQYGAPSGKAPYSLDRLAPISYKTHYFSEHISLVSKDFIIIFNQSEQSEILNLSEIAGPGYRKALEFLIKDFVISKKPDISEEVKRSYLGDVITNHVDDSRIQATAKRAAWLGNDETHYYRKWENKDISDLKTLIELTVRWIESVQLTEEYEKTMPSVKK
jgi:hypothetical protein